MIINVRGTNGSGKTTVMKSLMGLATGQLNPVDWAHQEIDSPTKKDPQRRVTKHIEGVAFHLPNGSRLGIFGSYKNNCGGCDEFSWKGAHDAICEGILRASRMVEHVAFEGITVSSVYTRYVNLAQKCWEERGQKTHWLLLNPSLETCLQRIVARSGTTVTDRLRTNVGTKHQVVASFPAKIEELYREHPQVRQFLEYSVHADTPEAIAHAKSLVS